MRGRGPVSVTSQTLSDACRFMKTRTPSLEEKYLTFVMVLVTTPLAHIRPFVRFIAKCTDRTLQAYLLSCKENSLVPFTTDDVEATILPGKFQKKRNDEDLLAKYDKVVMGGSVVTPPGAESNINSDLYL